MSLSVHQLSMLLQCPYLHKEADVSLHVLLAFGESAPGQLSQYPVQHILQTAGGIIPLTHGYGSGRLSLEGGRGLQPFSFLGCGCDILLL